MATEPFNHAKQFPHGFLGKIYSDMGHQWDFDRVKFLTDGEEYLEALK
ncbi:hypothetical protein M3226_25075 [Neobacillus cucumis]|nr:hypothetical protein [Neobacillus cucumis]